MSLFPDANDVLRHAAIMWIGEHPVTDYNFGTLTNPDIVEFLAAAERAYHDARTWITQPRKGVTR